MGGAKLRARTRSQYALAQPTAQQLAPVILRVRMHMCMHMHMHMHVRMHMHQRALAQRAA